MQLETQLADMYANRTVLDNAVVLSLSEDGASDPVLAQVLRLAVESSLCQEAQQIPEPRRFLKRWAGGNPLNQLPAGICPKCRIHFRHPRSIPSRCI